MKVGDLVRVQWCINDNEPRRIGVLVEKARPEAGYPPQWWVHICGELHNVNEQWMEVLCK